MKWDDLKILSVVGRLGSFSAAAKELGVNHSSVSRRMRELENHSGQRLFERLPKGLVLTALGDELFSAAKRMVEVTDIIERNIFGTDTQLRGVIRFATVDATAQAIMPSIQKFLARYPYIELELIMSQQLANLSRREADVVLRATNTPPETYVGRKVAKHVFPIYGSRTLLKNFDVDTPLDAFPWVAWEDGFTQHWMDRHVPAAHIVYRANTAFGISEAIKAGIGIAHYASFGGDVEPNMVRLRPPDPELDLDLWLLIHPDQRHSARISTFMTFMADELNAQRDLIEGRLGGRGQSD